MKTVIWTAAKVRKPCSELNRREAESRREGLPYLYYWVLIRMHRKCFGRSSFAVAGLVRYAPVATLATVRRMLGPLLKVSSVSRPRISNEDGDLDRRESEETVQ